jgi:hypothetical protein
MIMETKIVKISLSGTTTGSGPAVEQTIKDTCDNFLAAGYKLASTMIVGTDVVLIFQP